MIRARPWSDQPVLDRYMRYGDDDDDGDDRSGVPYTTYGENPLKRLRLNHPLFVTESQGRKRSGSGGGGGGKEKGDTGRVLYNTVKLVHEPVYGHAHRRESKELKKILTYDPIKACEKKYASEKASATLSGDEKLKNLKHWLDNLGLKRHFLQVKFHEQMILACLSKIYEDEWETQYEQIMKRFGIRKMKRELIFSCPRRFGKTYSVALFAAAYLLSIPKCQVAIFSTGKRTAKKLMVLILHFLTFYPEFEQPGRVKVKNQEDLVLNFGPGDDRCLSCYPSSVKVTFFFRSLCFHILSYVRFSKAFSFFVFLFGS